jgi:hypothetical protein
MSSKWENSKIKWLFDTGNTIRLIVTWESKYFVSFVIENVLRHWVVSLYLIGSLLQVFIKAKLFFVWTSFFHRIHLNSYTKRIWNNGISILNFCKILISFNLNNVKSVLFFVNLAVKLLENYCNFDRLQADSTKPLIELQKQTILFGFYSF